jgi:Tol biopolymer transport system component
MRPDGTSLQHIAQTGIVNLRSVTVSPNARWVAYLTEDLSSEAFLLHIVRADGSIHRTITNDLHWDYRNRTAFAWSPDSEWIAYWTLLDNVWAINRIRLDGSEQQLIPATTFTPNDLYWLPDNQSIMLAQADLHGAFTLFKLSVDGVNLDKIVDSQERFSQMTMSADGEWAVYQTYTNNGWNIYRARTNGSHNERILANRWVTYIGNLAWSPTGEWISFTTYPADDTCIHYRIRPDGRDLEAITEACVSPIWSTDGNWLLFRDFRMGSYAISRLNVDDGAVQQLSPLGFDVESFTQSTRIDLEFGGVQLIIMSALLFGFSILLNHMTTYSDSETGDVSV